MWEAKASFHGNVMPIDRRRAPLNRVAGRRPKCAAAPDAVLPPLTDAQTNDVRPEKVAKARQLINTSAYPPEKVVRSLADQIARFF